jgi:hypothetical protein
LLAARVVGFGVRKIGLRLHKVCARLVERILERPLVYREQQIALLDDLPVLEMNLVEVTGNPRANLNRIDCGEAADIFVIVHDRALDRLCNGDRWRRRRTRMLLLLAAACDQSRNRQQHREFSRAIYHRK